MLVLGTAGHVDHGKSTLIAALTGIHPDRLKEEQEREMTIDLGFAWLTLPGEEEIGIVDVPGHRDFIENMLAGVGGIDAVMLVVAADEGVMPQTREHIAILDLLQIKAGLVVLTKIDLVDDPDWIPLVEVDIRKVLQGTVLEPAPILRVSSRTKAGFPDLVDQLHVLAQNIQRRPDLARPRLPVDRVFTMAGFGTVVTGTLLDGQFEVGQEVEILPSGMKARIRGLQTHKKSEAAARPGSRTAVNLSGVEVKQVRRGEVVTLPGQYRSTQRLDVQFHLLPGASGILHHHTEVKVFLGTAETPADVRLLGTEALHPGETGWLQLELHQPLVAMPGDRFILRRPSPPETLGGGAVLDPAPKERHKRFDDQVIARLQSLLHGSPADRLFQASLALGPAPLEEFISRSQLSAAEAAAASEELLATGQLIRLDQASREMDGRGVVMALPQWQALKKSVHQTVESYHQSYPLRRGIPKEELKNRLKLPPRVFQLVIHEIAAGGDLLEESKYVALPLHRVRFSPFQQVKVDQLMSRFADSPLSPPTVKECQAEVGEEIYTTLLDSGEFVAVSPEVVFRKTDYDKMVEALLHELDQKGRITLAETRDLFNTSRRYCQALLEHLDSQGLTVREGDYRRLVK